MGGLRKSDLLMPELPERLLSPTIFLRYIISLIMLFVILLSILMMLLFTLNMFEPLICGNSLCWVLKLNLTFETLWIAVASDLFISML